MNQSTRPTYFSATPKCLSITCPTPQFLCRLHRHSHHTVGQTTPWRIWPAFPKCKRADRPREPQLGATPLRRSCTTISMRLQRALHSEVVKPSDAQSHHVLQRQAQLYRTHTNHQRREYFQWPTRPRGPECRFLQSMKDSSTKNLMYTQNRFWHFCNIGNACLPTQWKVSTDDPFVNEQSITGSRLPAQDTARPCAGKVGLTSIRRRDLTANCLLSSTHLY